MCFFCESLLSCSGMLADGICTMAIAHLGLQLLRPFVPKLTYSDLGISRFNLYFS